MNSHRPSTAHWPVPQVHDGHCSLKVVSSSPSHQESRCDQSQKDAAGGTPLTQTPHKQRRVSKYIVNTSHTIIIYGCAFYTVTYFS